MRACITGHGYAPRMLVFDGRDRISDCSRMRNSLIARTTSLIFPQQLPTLRHYLEKLPCRFSTSAREDRCVCDRTPPRHGLLSYVNCRTCCRQLGGLSLSFALETKTASSSTPHEGAGGDQCGDTIYAMMAM
jgi:hypothetical protein